MSRYRIYNQKGSGYLLSGILSDGAVDKIVSVTSKVERHVSVTNLFSRYADVIKRLRGRGVAEHLLEEQQLTGVVPGHKHLVVGKRLAQRMGSTELRLMGTLWLPPWLLSLRNMKSSSLQLVCFRYIVTASITALLMEIYLLRVTLRVFRVFFSRIGNVVLKVKSSLIK